VDVNGDGIAGIAWGRRTFDTDKFVAEATTRRPEASRFDTFPQTLAVDGETPKIGVDAEGVARAVWSRLENSARVVETSTASAAADPHVTVVPASLDFGSVHVGEKQTREVQVENTGGGTLHIEDVGLTLGFGSPDLSNCAVELHPGDVCHVHVTLTPADETPRSGSLTFFHDATGGETSVALTGQGFFGPGEGPQAHTDVTELQFQKVKVGDTSFAIDVKFKNTGTAPLHISAIGIQTPFAVVPGGCKKGNVLQPNQTCTIKVVFKPTEEGEVTAHLVIFSDAENATQLDLRLTGIGTVEHPLAPAVKSDVKKAAASAPKKAEAKELLNDGVPHIVTTDVGDVKVIDQSSGLIGQAGTNLIGQAGTNLIGQAGTNLIGQAGTNLIGQAGTNKLAAPALRAAAATSRKAKCPRAYATKYPGLKCKQVLLATGQKTLAKPGKATILVKPTKAGKALLKKAIKYAKKQRAKGKKVKPLTLSFATIVRPTDRSVPSFYMVRKLKVQP
jgi:hypothetical protein